VRLFSLTFFLRLSNFRVYFWNGFIRFENLNFCLLKSLKKLVFGLRPQAGLKYNLYISIEKEDFMPQIRPCVDFLITQKCNYRCEYCSQSKKFYKDTKSATDETINAFLGLVRSLDKGFEITISGGEPLLHPRFYDVIGEIKKQNLKLTVVSNFSFPLENYTKIVDIMGDNLLELFVSYHPSQVVDFEDFKQKAREFNRYKSANSRFTVASVVSDENISQLKKLADFLDAEGITFAPQHMRIKNSYVNYENEARKFLEKRAKPEPGRVLNTFGKMCHAGCKFLFIYENGDAYRCYSSRFNASHCMGNIKDKNFHLFLGAAPCMNTKCTCPKPLSFGMLDCSKSDYKKAGVLLIKNAVFLPYLIVKNFKVLRAKFRQGDFFHK